MTAGQGMFSALADIKHRFKIQREQIMNRMIHGIHKYIRAFAILSFLLLALTGCGETAEEFRKQVVDEIEQMTTSSERKITNQMHSFEVSCMAANDAQIYQVRYPYAYTVFNKEERECDSEDLTDVTEPEELSEEDFLYFTEYMKELDELDGASQSTGDIAYRIIYDYYDENGESVSLYISGRDGFPEGFEEFLERYNEICGGKYLTYGETIQRVTPEFLTESFGVTDKDVEEGTLQDVIDVRELDMVDVVYRMFDMDVEISGYYADIKEHLIDPYRPYELKSVESTEEEYDEIVEAYLEILGTDTWEETESDQKYLRCLWSEEEHKEVYIGKTTDLENMCITPPTWEGEYYQIELDAHMEDMTMLTDFVYSKDGKFMLVDEAVTDHILEFIEID